MDIVVRIREIKGSCPVYKLGDFFTLKDGYRLISDNPVCMHSLSAIMPFYNALRFCGPQELALSGKDDQTKAYVHCPDCFEYTAGGTVVLELSKA